MISQTAESGQDQERGRKASSDSDMQGQLVHHENQVSSRDSSSTTAAMDDSQPVPPSTSTAPQIRSRITVVCAECKRLKLKCDRRTPCGSCTKRDTVSRCIYSPAAAEKVDLHSINNRLIQVETLLSMITSGKTPPPFQSSYPLAQVLIGPSHSAIARLSHVTADIPSPISIRMHDLVNIWLAHCQLDIFTPGNQTQDGPFVKLEQLPVELLHLSGSDLYHKDTILMNQGVSASRNDTATARHTLPPPHLYNTQCQEEYISEDPFLCEYTASQGKLSSVSSSGQPFATPAIFAHLPHPAVRIRLLDGARSAIPHLSLLIHWTRVAELAETGVAAARAEQDRHASSANAVFGAHTSSRSPSPSPLAPPSSAPSLPLFACLCLLLALGALPVESPSDTSVDHSFLYALAGQAIGVWEEYKSFPDAKEEDNYLESVDDSVDAIKAKQAEEEKAELDHVVALLLQVKYLLHTGSATSVKVLSEAVFPLIGKLVNAARGLGLTRDPESETGARKNTKDEERRRMIWWDIMFYDIFISDVLEQTPLITSYSYNTRFPAIAHASLPDSSKRFGVNADGNDEGDPSTGRGDEDERRPLFAKASCPTKVRISPRFIPPPKTRTKTKVCSPILDNAETGFFGVRCRLTRLAQNAKHRLSHPDCDCCSCESSYTLDQAAKVESEIRAWTLDLPSSLRLESSSASEIKCPKHTAIAAELAVLANRMIISAYVPLMRPPQDGAASSSTSVYSAAHPWNPASRATLDAAQGVVRAASVLYRLPGNGMSFMCDFYPLQKAVTDALVICAHSGFASTKPGRTVVLVEEVNDALEVLDAIGPPQGKMLRLLTSMKRRIGLADVCRKGEENTLKRKRAVLEVPQPIDRVKMNGHMEATPMEIYPDNCYGKTSDSLSSVSEQSHRPVIPPSPQRQNSVPRSNKGNDRKHSRKSSYPVVGNRDQEKDSGRWLIKKGNVAKSEGSASEELPVEEMHPNSFQPQQLSPIQHPISQSIADDGYRSRSSSVSHTSRLQTSEYAPHYTEEQDEDIHASQRRRFSINSAGQHQPHQLQQVQQSLTPPGYIHSQQSSRTGSYEAPHSFDQSIRSFDQGSTSSDSTYGGPPSPYANSSSGHLSAASSPYGSAAGHPQTPVMYPSSNSHHPSPPDFVQQSAVPSPQAYYHMSSGYESYDAQATQQRQVPKASTIGSPIPEQNQISTPPGEAMISQVSQALPIYEKTMYDVKAPAELVQQQHQIHHYQVSSGRGTPIDHLPMNSPTPQAWTTTGYIHSQQPLVEHQDSQYWSTGQMYYS